MTRTRLSRDYWRLWWANAISSTGDGAFAAALPLLAVTITRDPRLVSVVTAATYLPWLLLSLPAGAVVDRYDRTTLMVCAQTVQAAVVAIAAILVVTRQASIEVLAAAGLLLGSAEVVFSNAAQSVLPALVPPDLLPRANGSQQVSLTVGESFLGPPAGSLLFAAAAALPFGLDAASFAGSAALLARLPRTAQNRDHAQRPPIRAQIAEGLRWLARHRLLRVVAVLLGIYNFANQMGQAILVLLATQTLHVSTRGYGLLLAASAVGSVLGGLVNPVLSRRLGVLPALILPALVDAAAFIGIGLAPGPAVVAALLAVQGFCVTLWNVVTVSLRQRVVPGPLLGRVNSVYRMLGWGLMPLGALAGGFVAHTAGLRAPFVAAGLLCALSALAALPLLVRALTPAAGRSVTPAPFGLPAPTGPPAPPTARDTHRPFFLPNGPWLTPPPRPHAWPRAVTLPYPP
jgi:MFS family permease